jgi:hypothetical protein
VVGSALALRILEREALMLQDDQTLADEVTLMARAHFNKLASLAVRVQGARELGVVAAHSSVGDSMIPTEFVIEKMAAAWAHRRSIQQTQIDLEKLSSADLEKLGSAAYDELGEAHMEKLAAGVLGGSIAWDELTDMEKVAVGWMGSALKGIKKGWNVMTKGKNVTLPTTPQAPGSGIGGRLREGWNVMTGRGRTVKPPAGVAPPKATPPPAAKHTQGTGTQATGQAGPTGQAPDLPAPKRKPWMRARTKLMLGGGLALTGGTYLGGKALDTGSAFLTPQPPGTAYQYGGGAPSHFMRSQMGM